MGNSFWILDSGYWVLGLKVIGLTTRWNDSETNEEVKGNRLKTRLTADENDTASGRISKLSVLQSLFTRDTIRSRLGFVGRVGSVLDKCFKIGYT